MARPNWEYIRVDVLFPEHPKTDGLSDKAFRTLIELWCYCGRNRTDGIVTDARWRTSGTAAARRQLIDHGYAQALPVGGYVMHDYGEHQRTRAEIDEQAAARSAKARKAAQVRWGTDRPP